MPDRLAELRRQRALVQDHLAWLDREIAATSAVRPSDPSPAPLRPVASTAMPITANAPTENPAEAETILEQYRVPATMMKQDVRKGCLLYFAGALALLALGVAILFFVFRRP
ncbi:MAG: hypothetical protein ABIZ49_12405 [Opitutaceae bacterium]